MYIIIAAVIFLVGSYYWVPFLMKAHWLMKFRPNPIKIDDKLQIIEAFSWGGKKYYQCETATDLAAGRGMNALIYYEEFRMKCDKEYLAMHIRATELCLAGKDGKMGLDHILGIKTITQNLKERIDLVAMPDHVFRLASIYFWDESESPYYYNFEYNQKKIAEWKKDPEALSFFLSQPLKEFLPFSGSEDMSAQTYLNLAELLGKEQQKKLQAILSKVE